MIRTLEECQLTKLIQEKNKVPTELPQADIEDLQKPSWLIQEQLYLKMGKRLNRQFTKEAHEEMGKHDSNDRTK